MGTPGVGKTALALHWAHRVRRRFPDGQLYSDLRGYGTGRPVSADQILDRFLLALGATADVVPHDVDGKAGLFRSLIADRRILVILDNAATTAQLRPLLPGTSTCAVLVTSRDRLSGLVALEGARRLTVRALESAEGVALLEGAAARHRPDDSPEEVAELARLCGHLPLALRVAAERAVSRPYMPLGDLLRDLRDESTLWTVLASEPEDESHVVRSVFSWSYRPLPEETAGVFRSLGLYPGVTFGTNAIAALCGMSTTVVRHALDALVGAHLVEQTDADLYQVHDLLRSFALDRARNEDPEEKRRTALENLAHWYLYSADAAARATDSHLRHHDLGGVPRPETEVPTFSGHQDALRWFDRESLNMSALVEATAEAGLDALTWRFPVILRHVYVFYACGSEWERMIESGMIAATRERNREAEADLLEASGMACVQGHRYPEGLERHRRAHELRRTMKDEFGVAMSLNAIGIVHLRVRRLDQAAQHFRRSLEILEPLSKRTWSGIALGNLARTRLEEGRFEESWSLAERAARIHHETGNRLSEFSCLTTLCVAQRESGHTEQAFMAVRLALEVAAQLGGSLREALALLELGMLLVRVRSWDEAIAAYQRAAVLYRQGGDLIGEARVLEATADAHLAMGRADDAVRSYARAIEGYRSGDHYRRSLAHCLYRLGELHRDAGRDHHARREYEEALEVLKGSIEADSSGLRERIEGLIRNGLT
ncbi:ATP-binding protein [Nocardiopsis sp. NPDC055551]